MKKYNLITFGVFLAIIIIAGCSNEQLPVYPDGSVGRADIVGDIPTASTNTPIISAHLSVAVGFANGQPVNVHSILEDWDPGLVTWNLFNGNFNPDVEGSFLAEANGWFTVDLTDLVQRWINGEQNNFGVLLVQSSPAPTPLIIHSTERLGFEPFIEIRYTGPDGEVCDTVLPTADVFIEESIPDANFAGTTILRVGEMMIPGAEKQALIIFDLPTINSGVEFSAIGGQVWDDLNQDGILDSEELGAANVSVALYDCNEVLQASILTDATGMYRFDSLTSGEFNVKYVAPQGYAFSPADQVSDETLDSDADPATGLTECFVIGVGEVTLNWSAGVFRLNEGDSGCTYSKGYWKNHAGNRPQQSDAISPLLPIWLGDVGGDKSLLVDSSSVAVAVLSMKISRSPSNGILKLYAQLLATKLNIFNGALDTEIADVIAEADNFLADHDYADWKKLDKGERKIVLEWMSLLDKYNDGEIGPGSCDN